MAEKPQPVRVLYCAECGLPAEYCEFGPDFEKCKPWLIQNAPNLYPDLVKGSSFFFLLLSNPNPWICFALGSGFFSFLYFSHDFRMQKRMKRKLQGQLISCSRLEFLVQMVAEPLHLVFLFPFLRNLGCIWMFFILWLVWMAAGKLGIRLEYLGLFGIVSDLLLCFCFRNLCFLKHFSFLNRNRRVTFGMNTLK